MSYERKTYTGDLFPSTLNAIEWILLGRWVYIGDRPVSPHWVRSWSLLTIDRRVRNGQMYECLDFETLEPYYGNMSGVVDEL